MQQVFRYGMTAGFLLICTWQDVRSGKISGKILALFAATGMVVHLLTGGGWHTFVMGILPGIVILLFGKISGEQIGYGDGAVILVTGLFLTGRENIGLFFTGLFLSAAFVIVLFFTGKLKKQMSLPFLPFLLAGFVLRIVSVYV